MPVRKRIYSSIAFFLIAAILAGCSNGRIGMTVYGPTRRSSDSMPEVSIIPTLTRTRTATPTITPTVTKVPDLEIVNSSWVDGYFMGNIVNNTDATIMLPSRDFSFIFNFDFYDSFGDSTRHYWEGPDGLKPGIEAQSSNCILYPYETGIIFFEFVEFEKMPGFSSNQEMLKDYTGPLGFFYTYTSYFKPVPDLPTIYHPKAQNVKYHVDKGTIYFEYDINVPAPKEMKDFANGLVMGFLTMYDHDGNIINILYNDISYFLPQDNPFDHVVHMNGQSPRGDPPVVWQWFRPITEQDLLKIDHIDLLFETQYEGVCFDKRYP